MSNKAHSGRCFRSKRATVARKKRQGVDYDPHPIRWKVPAALRPFLSGPTSQMRAQHDQFAVAIGRYNQHRTATGLGAPVRAEGQAAITQPDPSPTV